MIKLCTLILLWVPALAMTQENTDLLTTEDDAALKEDLLKDDDLDLEDTDFGEFGFGNADFSDDNFSDDSTFSNTEHEPHQSHWANGFKTTLQHSHTHAFSDNKSGTQFQRTSVRIAFEKSIADGWYIKIDDKFRYFWHEDQQATQQDESYGFNTLQAAWIQYSQGACSYKAGRQNLIWGEVEGTFAVDVITPFDYTEQLLTDYSAVRMAQDMLFSECFLGKVQTQLFFIPEAHTNVFQHYNQRLYSQSLSNHSVTNIVPILSPFVDTGPEWGGRLKFNWAGGDVSLMYANLFGNSPTIILKNFQPALAVAKYQLYGLSSAIASGRLLTKLDIGYKTNQLISASNKAGDTLDVAIGFEYTTASNHHINGGMWRQDYLNGQHKPDPIQLLTVGWNNSYLNDDLAMSLLGNWADNPKLASATLLAEYQWDDYWRFSSAISVAHLRGDNTQTESAVLSPPDESITFAATYEF